MSRYSFWTKPRNLQEREFHERAFRYQDLPRWEARWHTLSPQARLALLKDIKVPQQTYRPNQGQPGVKADRFAASVLEELRAAGFVELRRFRAGGSRDRVLAVAAAADFMNRVRTLDREHLLRDDLPSQLGSYVGSAFTPRLQ